MAMYIVNATEPDGQQTRVQLGCAEAALDFLAWLAFDGRKGELRPTQLMPERSPEELARAMALLWRYASATGIEYSNRKHGNPEGEQQS